jgi:glutamate racemase
MQNENSQGVDRAIGVFDSGIGGLTVVRSLMSTLPRESIVYFGDTARVPYGPKSPDVVRMYARQDTEILLKHNVKMIVVACNTVSSVALDVVEAHSPVPVIGVIEPAAMIAARITKTKRIGVIGTLGTISSGAYTRAIHRHDASIQVEGQPCPLFVPLAEEGWDDHEASRLIAHEYIAPLVQKGIDTLVLGCTHYPILKDIIAGAAGEGITLIDSADSTAEAVAALLQSNGLLQTDAVEAEHSFLVSDVPYKFREVGQRFLGRELASVVKVGDGEWT